MTNLEILSQLRCRRDRISELLEMCSQLDVAVVLSAENNYVEALITYREKHGGIFLELETE